jgi:membrane protease YdiL (CAAX protease family)
MASLAPADLSVPALIAGLLVTLLLIAGIVADAFLLALVIDRKVNWAGHVKRLRARPWQWHDGAYLLLVLGTLFATMILGAQIMDRCCIILSDNAERILMLVETVLMQVVAVVAIEHLRRRHRHSCSESFSMEPLPASRALAQGVLFYVAMMPPLILVALATNYVFRHFGLPVESQDILKGFADPTAPFWFRSYLVILAVAFAPVVEELIFRGIALPIAARNASPAAAIVFVSVLFAIVHGHLPAMAPLFVVAVSLSLGYVCSGSVLVPMIMHALFNGINLVIFYLSYDMIKP